MSGYASRLGRSFRVLRVLRGHTQAHVAELAGISVDTVQNVECGRSGRVASHEVMANALGMPLWKVHRYAHRNTAA